MNAPVNASAPAGVVPADAGGQDDYLERLSRGVACLREAQKALSHRKTHETEEASRLIDEAFTLFSQAWEIGQG